MCDTKPQTSISQFQIACRRLFRKKDIVPPELQAAINDCTTLQDLIELLFATDYTLDEAMLTAFDNRFAELEQGHTLTVYQTIKPKLKNYNNGNRTV